MSSLARQFRSISSGAVNAGGAFSFNFSEAADETYQVTPAHIIHDSAMGALNEPVLASTDSLDTKARKKKKSKAQAIAVLEASATEGVATVDVDNISNTDRFSQLSVLDESTNLAGEAVITERAAGKGKARSGSSKKKKKKLAQSQQATNGPSRPPPGLEKVDPIYAPGPIVLSHKDPELSEEQKNARRFGHGINVTAIGPRKTLHKDPNWAQNLLYKSFGATQESSQPASSSPFSFGFGLSS